MKPNETKATNVFFMKPIYQYRVSQWELPFFLALDKKKLDSIHRWISSRFKDKLWIQTKRRLQMLFSQKQRNNIMYPNENYPSAFVPIEKKIDSIHGRSSSRFKDKLWFQTKWSLQKLFSWNQRIDIMYPYENCPFVLAPCENKLDCIQRQSSSHFKDKLWFKTKRRLKIHFSRNQRISIVYLSEIYQYVLPNVKTN